MRNIRVVAHNPVWPAAFEQQAAVLAGILGHGLVTIHHIGSTAVPGLPAKPVIDMMPLEQLTTVTEPELLKLHGMGPKALSVLRAALQARGLSFANQE